MVFDMRRLWILMVKVLSILIYDNFGLIEANSLSSLFLGDKLSKNLLFIYLKDIDYGSDS